MRKKDLFSDIEAENWPSHTMPARLGASDKAHTVVGRSNHSHDDSLGRVAIRSGGRMAIIQRSGPAPTGGLPPLRTDGDIEGQSVSSRRRMRQLLSTLRRDTHGLFLTLTYQTASVGGRDAKRHLHAFFMALTRRWKGVKWASIWKLEYQKRGTPHFHLLISGISFEHKEWFKRTWNRITGEGEAHRKVGAFVERWPKGSKLSVYCAKYMAKDGASFPGWSGRIWGVRRRKNLPVAPVDVVYLVPYDVAYRAALALAAEWGTDDRPVPYSMRVWADDPRKFIEQILQEYDTKREAIQVNC